MVLTRFSLETADFAQPSFSFSFLISQSVCIKGRSMTILNMLEQSAILTVLGMTIVFAFLWIMIICITLVGRLVHYLGWDKEVAPQKAMAAAGGTQNDEAIPKKITAAIMAAVSEYRKTELTRE
jgi:oxaloacetate decarboxylase gamma subunit